MPLPGRQGLPLALAALRGTVAITADASWKDIEMIEIKAIR